MITWELGRGMEQLKQCDKNENESFGQRGTRPMFCFLFLWVNRRQSSCVICLTKRTPAFWCHLEMDWPNHLCWPPGHTMWWYSTHGRYRAGDQPDESILLQGRNTPTSCIPSSFRAIMSYLLFSGPVLKSGKKTRFPSCLLWIDFLQREFR
jgi:hypothetical protein